MDWNETLERARKSQEQVTDDPCPDCGGELSVIGHGSNVNQEGWFHQYTLICLSCSKETVRRTSFNEDHPLQRSFRDEKAAVSVLSEDDPRRKKWDDWEAKLK